jgi:hypothetical protein
MRTTAAVAVLAVLLIAAAFKPVVENDGIGYFAYLHSVVVDRDLDLADEYQAAAVDGIPVWPGLVHSTTSTGRTADFFPVGPALMASPAYLLALAVRPSGAPQWHAPFSTAITLASLLYGLLALVLSFLLARSVIGRREALVATLAMAGATPFVYYLLYEPSYSHTFSAFMVAAFVLAWWQGRDGRTTAGWLLLGLLGGLLAVTRFQDGPLVAIALLDLPRARWRVLLLLPGVLLGFAPQLATDQYLFGSWLPVRPAGQDLQLLPGHYWEVLFSSWHGLFTWSPVLLAAVAGLVLLPDRRLKAAFAYALLVETLINGAAPDWWAGFSFGMRRFLDLTPFFVLGLAAVGARLPSRVSWSAASLLTAWNLLLVANFTYIIRTDRDPGYLGLIAGQVPALHYLPHLVTQGAVVRALLLWPVLGTAFDPLTGLTLLALQVLCVVGALALAGASRPGSAGASPAPSPSASAGGTAGSSPPASR